MATETDAISAALAADDYPPTVALDSVWEDVKARRFMPDGHVRLVKLTKLGKTVSGWQATVRAYHGTPPADWLEANYGVIYLDTLVAEYEARPEVGR